MVEIRVKAQPGRIDTGGDPGGDPALRVSQWWRTELRLSLVCSMPAVSPAFELTTFWNGSNVAIEQA
eukprot:3591717-Amphidinium_carterae.1